MTGALVIRRIRPGEEGEICGLVERVFSQFVAVEFPQEGIQEFLRYAQPAAMARRCAAGQVVLVAEQGGRIVGMLELRGAAHIALLFVEVPGRGIGRALFEEALLICRSHAGATGQIRTHASRYAVPIYEKLGFGVEGPERTENGITYVPMVADYSPGGYSIIIPEETVARAAAYLESLRAGRTRPGARLRDRLRDADVRALTSLDLLGCLVDTKRPQIFAESAVSGDGSDWNQTELGLLGDISIAVPVTVFDDGNHRSPTPHTPPFSAMLVFTPGALLRNGRGKTPADWNEATATDGRLSMEGYYNLYRRRLLPIFRYLNQRAAGPRSAFVTVPGLGCGQFAGPFKGQLGARLQAVLERLLTEHGASLPNVRAVYFDPYSECENARREIHGISFMVRPLRLPRNERKSQLCRPIAYAERGDDFSGCTLYSLVAWDHVSWPGNDFLGGSRATDDGVKAAATDSMSVLTGVEGQYDPGQGKYQPPGPYLNWESVVEDGMRTRRLRLWNPLAVWPRFEPVT